MLNIEPDGRLILMVNLPGARQVDVIGRFDGWHDEQIPMVQQPDGRWRLELTLGPGEHLFRYVIDGSYCLLEGTAHGTRTTADGLEMSRVWMPPPAQTPGAIAA